VAKVVGIDNVQSAIDDALVNARLNGISNASFVCGPAEKVMEAVLQVGLVMQQQLQHEQGGSRLFVTT
jgi:tRNA/tmRNA/rRNA uracil-C5-methylase (TrmA/RlmC/RlmD family)